MSHRSDLADRIFMRPCTWIIDLLFWVNRCRWKDVPGRNTRHPGSEAT